MPKRVYDDIKIGDKFGRWTVIGDFIMSDTGKKKWKCECECGTVSFIDDHALKSGTSKSCGCYKDDLPMKVHQTSLKQTFGEWCEKNDRADLLERFDYELNDFTPWEIGVNTHKKIWFKCIEHKDHKPELRTIQGLAKGVTRVPCSQCNSFGQWCLDHNRRDILDRWDYDLNKKDPFEVSYSSGTKFWFKCPAKRHESEQQNIGSLVSGAINDFYCKKCNSFAQWGIDTYGEDFLEKYWDYDLNEYDPWKIAKAANKYIYVKCQEKDYHGSYRIAANHFYCGKRCPYCAHTTGKVHYLDSLGHNYPDVIAIWSDKNKKSPFELSCGNDQTIWIKCRDGIHKDYKASLRDAVKNNFICPDCALSINGSMLENEVSNYILEKYPQYTLLHESRCTLKLSNPKNGHILPFDNEIKELKLLIEVMGEQHYIPNQFIRFYADRNNISVDEAFKEQQWRDNFKKQKALEYGYHYLDIPYYDLKGAKYKEKIDLKIKEILN